MKKLLSFLMVMVLLPCGALYVRAENALFIDQNVAFSEDMYFYSSVYMDGSLYLNSDETFYSYTIGDEGIKQLQVSDLRSYEDDEEAQPSAQGRYYMLRLFIADGKLHAADMEGGMILPLSVAGETISIHDGVKIDLDPLYNAEGQAQQVLGYDSHLYMIMRAGGRLTLLSYDLIQGGKAQAYQAENIWRIASYQDGKLLALVVDPENYYDAGTGEPRNYLLSVYDPQTDSLQEMGDSGLAFDNRGYFAFDAQSGKVYLQGKGEVYLRDASGNTAVAAYLIPGQYGAGEGDGIFVIDDERVLVLSGHNIAVRGTDPDKLPAVRLSIYGTYMNDAHQETMKAMSGLPVTFLDSMYFDSAQELAQSLVSGADDIDILVLIGDYMDIDSLMSKGYAADLSASKVLKEYTESLYPMMQDAGSYNEKLYMVPIETQSFGMLSYYPKLFEQVEADVPASYDALIDLIQLWNDELAEKYPDILPMQCIDYTDEMVRRAIAIQADAAAMKGEDFNYSDPRLINILRRVLDLRTDNISPKVALDSDDYQDQMDELYNKTPLMQDYWLDLFGLNYSLTHGEDTYIMDYGNGNSAVMDKELPLRLSVSEDEKPVMAVGLTMMAVNAKSKNADAAISYIEEYVKHINPYLQTMMNPSLNEDILNPYYEEELKAIEEAHAYYEEALKTAEGAEKTELEQNYERVKRSDAARLEEAKYAVRASTIAFYREMMENSYVRKYDQRFTFNDEEMNDLLNRLIQGQTPLDQFVKEADGKLRLMRLERQ